MVYVDKVREFAKIYPLESAVEMAIDYCIENDILADFLRKRRAEVMSMSIFEYNQEAHLRQVAEENRADGWEEGRETGHREGKIEGHREGKVAGILESVESLMETLGLTAEQAMEALRIPKAEWKMFTESIDRRNGGT